MQPNDLASTPASAPRRRRLRPMPPAPSFAGDDPLLTAREGAAYRRQGLSTFWRDVQRGTLPKPIYVSEKAPRWRLSWLTRTGP